MNDEKDKIDTFEANCLASMVRKRNSLLGGDKDDKKVDFAKKYVISPIIP